MAKIHLQMGAIILDLEEDNNTADELLKIGEASILRMYAKAVQYEPAQVIPDDDGESDEAVPHPESKHDIKTPDVRQAGGMFQ